MFETIYAISAIIMLLCAGPIAIIGIRLIYLETENRRYYSSLPEYKRWKIAGDIIGYIGMVAIAGYILGIIFA